MRYTQTPTYVDHVSRLQAEARALQDELDALSTVKRGTRSLEQGRRSTVARARLKTVKKNLDGLVDFSTFTWTSLFTMLAEAEACAWNDEQLALLRGELESYEGRGEKSLRHRFGLPIEATQGTCDFPDDGEGKYVGDKVDAIRVGKVGKRAYGRLFRELARSFKEDSMQPEQWDMLSDGEVSAGKVYHSLPAPVRVTMQQALAPETVLACYQTLFLMSDRGFVRVPRTDFATAFSLAAVTQMSPKYKLKREYVELRLRRLEHASD